MTQLTSKTDPTLSLEYSMEAVDIAKDLDDPLLLSNALNGLAIIYYYLGDQQQSLRYLLQSIEQMKKVREKDTSNWDILYRLAIFSSNAGNVYQGMGQLDSALRVFIESEAYYSELMNRNRKNRQYLQGYILCLNNKALVYRDLGSTEKAETTLNQALELSHQEEMPKGIAMCLNNLGLIEIERKAYQKALGIYTEALRINQQWNDSIAIAGTYNNIGLIYEETRDHQKALEYYKLSLQISERLKYLFGISNTSINIGKIYLALHQFENAEQFLRQGLVTARQGEMLQLQQQGYLHLSELFQQTGQYQRALDAYSEYSSVKDSIFNLERSRQIADMETRYEIEKKEQENRILRKDNELKRVTQRLLIVFLSALGIVVILLAILARYKTRILRQRTALFEREQQVKTLEVEKKEVERTHFEDQVFAEQEINRLQRIKLEEQNRKLAASAIHVTSKNRILLAILDEIDKEKKAEISNPEACFRRIRQTVQANLHLDKDWEKFKLHFEEVHPDFFIRLNKTYPNLTPGEQKICSYYRINLGTNEIAQILSITPTAVQKSRHRLRKKLGVGSETDLAAFMLRF